MDVDSARVSRRLLWGLAVAVPLAFVGVFFAYPVATILGRGLWPGGHVDLGPVTRVATDGHLRSIAWFTLWQAAASTAITVLLGLPAARVLARYRFRGRGLLHAAITVPFVLPTVVVGAAFLGLLGRHGPLGALGLTESVWAILIAHAFFNYAVVVRTVGGLWAHLDPRQEEAARVLGASRWRTFTGVTLPALRPAIVAAASIVFLFTFTSFGVILILGGPRFSTLETEIYRQTTELLDLKTAAALSIVQLSAVIAMLGVGGWARGRRAAALGLRAVAETARPVRGWRARGFVGANLLVMGLLLGAPLAVLVQRSLATPGGASLGFYRALAHVGDSTLVAPPLRAVTTSLVIATVTTVFALVIGGLAAVVVTSQSARRSWSGRLARAVDGFLMLPLGVSAVTVGFGFLVALDHPPLDLRTSPALIPIAHALVATPFVVRTLVPILQAIDPRLREAAAVLGASPPRVWREVDLPIVARAAAVAAGFAFAVSLGEFGATLFIVRPDTPTLPVVIYRLLGRPGPTPFGEAMAASVILMLLTAAAVLVIERLRVGDAGEF